MTSIFIRSACESDIQSITDIYAYYVQHSSISFELTPPDVPEMAKRLTQITDLRLPYLVAEVDDQIVGYAYAALYRTRAAYRFTVEDSIYVRPTHRGKGVGESLLPLLITKCEEAGYRQMVAVIGGDDNTASIRFHKKFGFNQCGLLEGVGYKFGHWVNTVLLQKPLGLGATTVINPGDI